MTTLNGMRVVFVKDTFITVSRTWRQRLFSWPWRPWDGTMPIEQLHPVRPGAAIMAKGTIYLHEADREAFMNGQLQKEWADSGEEAPRRAGPSSSPHTASVEVLQPMSYQESAIPFSADEPKFDKYKLMLEYGVPVQRKDPKDEPFST